MKRILAVILIIVVVIVVVGIALHLKGPSETSAPGNIELETQVFEDLKARGLEKSYVAIDDDSMLIRFEAPVNDKLNDLMYDVALDAYEIAPKDNVKVEAYWTGEPVLAMTAKGSDLENKNVDALVFEDIRRLEFKIKTDLAIFDVLIYDINVDETVPHITLEYLADEEGFWRDYLSMCLLTVEDASWIDEVKFEYLGEEDNLTLISRRDDILGVYSGELTPEEFVARIQIQRKGG